MPLNTELVVSTASIVTAAAALGISVFEVHQTGKHNRLSVAPRLRFDYRISPDFERASISVVNVGLGPAIVESFSLLVDRKTRKELNLRTWNELTALLAAKVTLYDEMRSARTDGVEIYPVKASGSTNDGFQPAGT